MANNNHEYGSKSIYHQHMECLNNLMDYNNHEYGTKSIYR